jgi:hypothetical protein
MTFLALVFLLAATVAIWVLPRAWAPVPLLAGACYMTLGQGIEVSGLNFPIIRLLLLAGVVRVLVRGERPAGGLLGMDKLFLAWGAWALVASAFHQFPGATLQGHLGMVYNAFCIYFLTRCFCQTEKDLHRLVRVIAWVLVPVAVEMLFEQLTQKNLFAMFGGVPDEPAIRNNRARSQGPFAHAILAGTVGAVCIPMLVGLWRRYPVSAKIGLAACGTMVMTSASSGPFMSVIFGLFALVLWRWRHWTKQMRIAAVVGYILLDLVMKAPPYYLIARIDLTGGSTGWHRAYLIESSLKHLHEWWFAGTDYTRHWMPTGVSWSPDHTDITNHYIKQGVLGGLPLTFLFIAILLCGFRYIGENVRVTASGDPQRAFLAWSFGAGLFAHAATCVSVSYFDQSVLFLYLTLAAAATLKAGLLHKEIMTEEAIEASGALETSLVQKASLQ